MQDQAGDSGRGLVRQSPFELAVEVADSYRAVDGIVAVGVLLHAGYGVVVLVVDVADDLFEDILLGDDTHQAAVFVYHQGEMFAARAEGLKLVEQQSLFGNKPGLGR